MCLLCSGNALRRRLPPLMSASRTPLADERGAKVELHMSQDPPLLPRQRQKDGSSSAWMDGGVVVVCCDVDCLCPGDGCSDGQAGKAP